MPNMSGRQLAERIEQLQPGAKILFMSGYADAVADAAAGQFLAEDASKFIQKPFSPEQLAAKVRFLLGPRPERPLNASAGDEV
jgi:CheY-like chemotaxis protein